MQLTNLSTAQIEEIISRHQRRSTQTFHPITSPEFKRQARVRWKLHLAYVNKYEEEKHGNN